MFFYTLSWNLFAIALLRMSEIFGILLCLSRISKIFRFRNSESWCLLACCSWLDCVGLFSLSQGELRFDGWCFEVDKRSLFALLYRPNHMNYLLSWKSLAAEVL